MTKDRVGLAEVLCESEAEIAVPIRSVDEPDSRAATESAAKSVLRRLSLIAGAGGGEK